MNLNSTKKSNNRKAQKRFEGGIGGISEARPEGPEDEKKEVNEKG